MSTSFLALSLLKSDPQKYTPPEDGHEEWLDTPFDETDAIVLHRFFDKHADKVGKELLSTSTADDAPEEGPDTAPGKRLWSSLCSSLIDGNQSAMIPQKSDMSSDQHDEYRGLMSRFHHRDVSSVQHLFVPADAAQVSSSLAANLPRLILSRRINQRSSSCLYRRLTWRR